MNEENKTKKHIFILGAALFSMFFGAGNLIFPPILGLKSGTSWLIGLFGFFLTGIGLPLLGVVATAKAGGTLDQLGNRVSEKFSLFIGISISLTIGPLLAIPRTGATAFEMAGQTIIPGLNPIVFSIVYFTIALVLVFNKSNVVDNIGKYLTPGLLLLLTVLILVGIFNPHGSQVKPILDQPFSEGFIEGYQTMDALASILFGGIIVASLKDHGIHDKKEQVKDTLKAGMVSVIALTFVYGGLGYLGSLTGSLYPPDVSKVDLIMNIAFNTLKSFGKYALAIVVSLACLTTTIGLVSSISSYFERISKGKLKYELLAIGITIFSAVISVSGVEKIVSIASPVLVFLYPMVIVLILVTIFISSENTNANIYRIPIFLSMLIGVLDVLKLFDVAFAKTILNFLPLSSLDLPWVVPAIVGILLGHFLPKERPNKSI